MKIFFDILHPAHVNFFKIAISNLATQHDVTVWVRPRGKLIKIANEELDVSLELVGMHYKGKIGKLFGLFQRVIRLTLHFWRNSYDVVASCGFYTAVAAKLAGKKSVIFYDDLEYKLNFYPSLFFATEFVIPEGLHFSHKNVKTYNGYKELAYLSHFSPDDSILRDYDLKKREYVFIRHVENISLNYTDDSQGKQLRKIVTYLNQSNIQMLVSLEQDDDKDFFNRATFVQEPCSDIYSLMYYAKCVISSGDTVAREAAIMGVPALYIGNRDMKINHELIALGRLVWLDDKDVLEVLEGVLNTVPQNFKNQNWVDTTEVILRHVEGDRKI